MKAIEFHEQSVVFAEDQPEYESLPAFKNDSEEGEVIFCMSMSLLERLRVLFAGKIWVSLMTFYKPLTPSYFTTKKSDVLTSKQ